MAFGSLDRHDDDTMSEINMTPLVDVMLVLLIIFMITMPVLTQQVPLDLPHANATARAKPAPALSLSLDAMDQLWLDGRRVSSAELGAQLRAAATHQPQPEVHLAADRNTRYERIAQTMALAQQAGLTHIAFVTQPDAAAK